MEIAKTFRESIAMQQLQRAFERTPRQRYSNSYSAGLNGTRSMARRRRQIAAGSLRVENGLVPAVSL